MYIRHITYRSYIHTLHMNTTSIAAIYTHTHVCVHVITSICLHLLFAVKFIIVSHQTLIQCTDIHRLCRFRYNLTNSAPLHSLLPGFVSISLIVYVCTFVPLTRPVLATLPHDRTRTHHTTTTTTQKQQATQRVTARIAQRCMTCTCSYCALVRIAPRLFTMPWNPSTSRSVS